VGLLVNDTSSEMWWKKQKKLVVSGQMDGCTFPSHLPHPSQKNHPFLWTPHKYTSSYLPSSRSIYPWMTKPLTLRFKSTTNLAQCCWCCCWACEVELWDFTFGGSVFFCWFLFCRLQSSTIYVSISFFLVYKFSINGVLGTYLIWKHLPSTILNFSTMCSHGTCTHVHASNTKNESYRKGLERTSRSHSFLRQSVMGIVNNPHGHPTKSVSSKNPIPRVTLQR
jgi:hypothetical protein